MCAFIAGTITRAGASPARTLHGFGIAPASYRVRAGHRDLAPALEKSSPWKTTHRWLADLVELCYTKPGWKLPDEIMLQVLVRMYFL